jgi:hypothetical protein
MGGRLGGDNSVGVAMRTEQRRGIGGREKADGQVPAISDTRGVGLASHTGASRGRCRARPARRKRPTTLF